MQVVLFSFGFKHGPPDADSVLDMRFLPNPYYVPELKEKNGTDSDVAAYVLDSRRARDFLQNFEPFLLSFLDGHASSDRDEIRLAVGCTGGRHRSVAVAEYMYRYLQDRGFQVKLSHRDIRKK